MSATIAEITIPATEFAAYDTLRNVDGLRLEVERVVAHQGDRVMPFLWVAGNGFSREALESAFESDSAIDAFELACELDGEWLYRMEWVDEIETLVGLLVEEEGTILAAVGNSQRWHLRIVFPDREALSATHEDCESERLSFDIQNIYELDEERKGRFGLTDQQQDLLVFAYESGYFDVPRESSAQDLAAEMDVQHQSLSEMFRRAHKNLLANTVMLGHGAGLTDDVE